MLLNKSFPKFLFRNAPKRFSTTDNMEKADFEFMEFTSLIETEMKVFFEDLMRVLLEALKG